MKQSKRQIETVAKLVRERARVRYATHLDDKPHEQHAACRMSCCWGSPVVIGEFEIAVCVPSAQHNGDERTAFFTFKKLQQKGK